MELFPYDDLPTMGAKIFVGFVILGVVALMVVAGGFGYWLHG